MDNNDIEHLITLTGEQFYQHIEEIYGKLVMKILRYHDVDSYKVLNQVSQQELIELFEKPDDENCTDELMNLKKEICTISQYSTLLKVGTRKKLISLLKSAQNIIKKKRFQLRSEARLSRVNQYRSTSPSTDDNNIAIDNNFEKYKKSIEESIDKLLIKMDRSIHGSVFNNVSVKNFQIFVDHNNELLTPTCSIQCVCNDRIKLYYKSQHFQLSNLIKHLNSNRKNQIPSTGDEDEELGEPQLPSGSQCSKKESTRSINNTSLDISTFDDTIDDDTPTPIRPKKTQSGNSGVVPKSNRYGNATVGSSKNRQSGQTSNRMAPDEGETHSSISILSSINKNKQMLKSQQRQTTNFPFNYRYIKSSHQQILWGKFDPSDILSVLLETIHLNSNRTPNNYRYGNAVLRFAACILILAGAYVYQFLRLNFKYLLPSIQTVNTIYKENPYREAQFRFNESKVYLDSMDCQYVFLSEDCSGIIPRVEYDSTFDCFNGFVTPIIKGKPIENAFICQLFEELQDLFDNHSRSNLVNVHALQPISNTNCFKPSATVLAAYGTDCKISSIDIIQRWLMMYFELRSRNIFVLGVSTDGDPKYLRAMRLAYNFFVKDRTIHIYNDKLSFTIDIPFAWCSWYFLHPTQLFLFLQDGIHLCNKMRNRLLSPKVCLRTGSFEITVEHLYQLIESTNKVDSNLSKSDLRPCEAIFRDARALSGVYSTRINFTIKQFLQRINKLNALTEIKQFESNNKKAKMVFPVHHKIKRINEYNESNNITEDTDFSSEHIEEIILRAYETAQEMVESVGMHKNLIKYKLYNIEESSKMAKDLLQMNTLTESEILLLDGRDDECSDEEDAFIAEEGEEEEEKEEGDVEDDNNESQYIQTVNGNDEDGIEDSIGIAYNDYPSEDDRPSTSTFENVQSTSYSGVCQKHYLLKDVSVEFI
ncbi:unnamed protein product [Rotaria sordida]|uniref:Uncharacterized protein n=1 Tax=Rotaria sordida TaxID=392033 RepID=A0A815QE79_9BILA|nr:unnamed protein product [Rotaria sordida]CAF1496142.1 unnamed protein product [Rotaria sordida]CAF3857305.1 unnamed protein product [Rotaria sordida]